MESEQSVFKVFVTFFAILGMNLSFQHSRVAYRWKALSILNVIPLLVLESGIWNQRNPYLKFFNIFAILDMNLSFQHSRVAYRWKALFLLNVIPLLVLESGIWNQRNLYLKFRYIFCHFGHESFIST